MSTCGHTTCLGPICTMAVSPKRPLIGSARDKAELKKQMIESCTSNYGKIIKDTPTGLEFSFWSAKDAGQAIAQFRQVPKVIYRISLTNDGICSNYKLKVYIKEYQVMT